MSKKSKARKSKSIKTPEAPKSEEQIGRSRFRPVHVWLGLGLLIGLVYSNSFQSDFVLDNEFVIKDDIRLKSASWENVGLIFSTDYWYPRGTSGLFRPLTTMTYFVESSILGFGGNPTNYHWLNLFIHWLNAVLVFTLVSRIMQSVWVGTATAFVFAVHPVTVESVTNLVGRADLLAASSVLSSLIFYVQATESTGRRRIAWLLAMALSTLVGAFCKENALVVVLLLPWYDLLFSTKKELSARSLQWWMFRFRNGYWILVPIVLLVLGVRYAMFKSYGPSTMSWTDNPLRMTDWLSAKMTAIKVIGYYLGLLTWPANLCCDYTFNSVPLSSWRLSSIEDWKAVLALVGVIALLLFMGIRYRQGKIGEAFFAGWFVIGLLPTANLLFLIDCTMAERFLYLPLIGFAACAVSLTQSLWGRVPRVATLTVATVVIVLLSARTYVRNEDWRTNLTLWSSAYRVSPESARVLGSLAWLSFENAMDQADWETIIPIAEKAVQIEKLLPIEQRNPRTNLKLGTLYRCRADALAKQSSGSEGEALSEPGGRLLLASLAELEQALAVSRASGEAQIKLLRDSGATDSRLAFTGAIPIYVELSIVYSRLGKHQEAVRSLREIQAIDPQSRVVYLTLPVELALSGDDRSAGIVLIQSLILGLEHSQTVPQLASIYPSGDPNGRSNFEVDAQTLRFNMADPIVRKDVEAAFVGLVELSLRSKRFDMAELLREQAASYGCEAKEIDELISRYDRDTRQGDARR